MKIVDSIKEMQSLSLQWKRERFSVGVVPTMGALHEGHLSLIDLISEEVDKIVVTLFVNPTQFGEGEDFSKYPRTFEADRENCIKHGADALFCPSKDEMYKGGNSTVVDETVLTGGLCGDSRPGHFTGVTTVVSKLYNAVLPDVAVFGEKDYQQLQVLRRMTEDLNFPIRILAAPIFRETDGLAMSSRNRYLSVEERRAAVTISRSLKEAVKSMREGRPLIDALAQANEKISSSGGKVDYIKVVDSRTLKEKQSYDGSPSRILAAAFYGPARLIDNMEV